MELLAYDAVVQLGERFVDEVMLTNITGKYISKSEPQADNSYCFRPIFDDFGLFSF